MLFEPDYASAKTWLFDAAREFDFQPIETGQGSLYAARMHWNLNPFVEIGAVRLVAPNQDAFRAFQGELDKHPGIVPYLSLPQTDSWVFDDPVMLTDAVNLLTSWLYRHQEFN